MKLEQRYTAKQVARLAIGSGCVVFLIITTMNLPGEWRFSNREALWADLSLFLSAVCATALMYYALAAFTRGVEQELWDKASLDPIRAFVNKRWWMILGSVSALFLIALLTIDLVTHWPRRHHIGVGMGYFWMSPFIALGQIRKVLKPKPEIHESIWKDDLKPLVSEHWGNRGTAAR